MLFDDYKQHIIQCVKQHSVPHMLITSHSQQIIYDALQHYIQSVYDSVEPTMMKKCVLFIDCLYQGNIQYMRNNVYTWIRSSFSISSNQNNQIPFRSIIFLNADSLSVDSQSALRRIIEIHSQYNRFIMCAKQTQHIIKPIQSRLAKMYIYDFDNNGNRVYNVEERKHKNIISLFIDTCKDVLDYKNNMNDIRKSYKNIFYIIQHYFVNTVERNINIINIKEYFIKMEYKDLVELRSKIQKYRQIDSDADNITSFSLYDDIKTFVMNSNYVDDLFIFTNLVLKLIE